MQTLKLADKFFPVVLGGTKFTTVRTGLRDIKLGPLAFEATEGGHPNIVVNVVKVEFCPLWNVSNWVLRGEGLYAGDWDMLHDVLKEFYPDVNEDTPITAIEFTDAEPVET